MLKKTIVESSRQDQIELLSGFIDYFLPLSPEEEKVFEAELAKLPSHEREGIMEITTSWMKKGIEQGKRDLVLRMLGKRLGSLQSEVPARIAELSVEQLEELAEALLDFASPADLTNWLDAHGT